MFKLGEKQTLYIRRMVDFGAYLEEKGNEDDNAVVLLPKSQLPKKTDEAETTTDAEPEVDAVEPTTDAESEADTAEITTDEESEADTAEAAAGEGIEVFLYKDSEDRLIATRKEPKLTLHQVGYLDVVQVSRIGAFLDWGLDKDLLLPFHEQPKDQRVKEGQEVLVAVYIDKSERLCATMNVYPYLRTDSPYHTGDQVTGTVYETSGNFGTFVAVDSIFSALIPKKELVRDLRIGETISARVTSVKEDGKLNLAIREKAFLQMDTDCDILLRKMENAEGKLPFTDKASPELIREQVNMSKNEFKRAIGRLLKEGKVQILADSIVLNYNKDDK